MGILHVVTLYIFSSFRIHIQLQLPRSAGERGISVKSRNGPASAINFESISSEFESGIGWEGRSSVGSVTPMKLLPSESLWPSSYCFLFQYGFTTGSPWYASGGHFPSSNWKRSWIGSVFIRHLLVLYSSVKSHLLHRNPLSN